MIYIAGTPRSGSSWTYEVTAELSRRYKLGAVRKAHLLDKRDFDAVLEGAPCIISIRHDIQAVLDSYFNRPKTATEDMPLSRYELVEMTCDSIKQAYLLPALKMTHAEITNAPRRQIDRIAHYLGVAFESGTEQIRVINEIHAMFTKEKVQAGGVGRLFQEPGHITTMGMSHG